MDRHVSLASVLLLCAAVLGAGALIGWGLHEIPRTERYVTVKGLAEREVKADLAIWPIAFQVAANDLGQLQKDSDAQLEIIRRFLTDLGFAPQDIAASVPRITDNEARTDGSYANQRSPYRYMAEVTLTVRSTQVERVKKAMEQAGTLIGRGVVFSAHNWEARPEFLFTHLNDVKPEMIALATKDARAAAENFARDSQSRVGKIRRANQGYFEINDRDQNTPEIKNIRVVASLEFLLVD